MNVLVSLVYNHTTGAKNRLLRRNELLVTDMNKTQPQRLGLQWTVPLKEKNGDLWVDQLR